MTRLVCLTALLALGGVAAGSSSQQPVQAPTLTVRTDLVTLTVTVVDRHGEPISGLRQEQFTVYDDGDQHEIQLFSADAIPATIGLVVDSSSSMRRHREDRAAVAAGVAAMGRPLDEFFSVYFNETVWTGWPAFDGFTADTGRLGIALVMTPARGMTALYDAVDRALEQLQQGTRDRKALIVVSDGGDNASSGTLAAVQERARRADAVIYTITFFDPDNREARPRVLKGLADETGGRAFTTKRPEEVTRAFETIAEEIRSGYTIGFVPGESVTGEFRSVRVVVDGAKDRHLIARTRAGYYARRSDEAGR